MCSGILPLTSFELESSLESYREFLENYNNRVRKSSSMGLDKVNYSKDINKSLTLYKSASIEYKKQRLKKQIIG